MTDAAGGPASQKLGAAGTGNLAGGPIRKEPQFLSNVGHEFLVLHAQLEASWATGVSDNLREGAATNAVQIAELLAKHRG